MAKVESALALAAALALGGCSLAPPLKVPDVPVAASYKEEAPWTKAEPADRLPRDAWWSLYGDADLAALEKKLIANSPDLAAALARYQEAQAVSDQLRSGLFPTLFGTANAQRDRQSEKKPLRVLGPTSPNEYGSYTVGAELDYEVDLWGRVRNEVASGNASAQAAEADLESARLSLEAELADTYIVLRGLDREVQLLKDTVTAYEKALDLTKARRSGGIASGLDVARAQTQLDSARSQVEQTLAQRALSEHAIAALIGESASSFAIEPRLADIALVQVPPGVPSTLLQRRPDIAAAERRVEAANAQIGVARAAFFPAITLDAQAGFQSSEAGNWIKAPNTYWSIGPSLLLTLFDAGKRKAEVAQAQAALDAAGAKYRSVAVQAFREVEDNLALLNHYRSAAESDKSAVEAAQRTLDFSLTRYREGAVSYLDVVTAQTTMLDIQREALDLDTRQLRASVQLIRAIGGGWSGTNTPLASSAAACEDCARATQ
ncbi:MAG TPA: efflux transporter outer membrane subunit [Rhodanobacteraceae bacterium]|nr:efflux transporter outer membrane subunit [Rhodanobacteraceae bacterium]